MCLYVCNRYNQFYCDTRPTLIVVTKEFILLENPNLKPKFHNIGQDKLVLGQDNTILTF